MKAIKLAALAACLALLAPGAIRADDSATAAPAARNFHFTIGYKLWSANWTTWDADNNGNQFSLTDGSLANVPNVSMRWHNWLASGSYVSTGSYNFSRFTDVFCLSGRCYTETRDYHAKRTEWDANVGYFLPTSEGTALALTAGYKNVSQKFSVDYVYPSGFPYYNFNSSFNFDVAGPTLGVLGSASVGHGFSIYGNGVGGWMQVKHDPFNNFKRGLYEAGELGLAWRPQTVPLSITFGYKYQVLETSFSRSRNKGEDITRGYILGINYTF